MRRTKRKPEFPGRKHIQEHTEAVSQGIFSDPDAVHKVPVAQTSEGDHGRPDKNRTA